MITNLKKKLSQLPKADVAPKPTDNIQLDFECSVFINKYNIQGMAHDYDISMFANCDTDYLGKACKLDISNIKLDEMVFFDTETTGLAGGNGTVAFLVGVGRVVGNNFIVKQFLLNDYHQETSMLNEFVESLKGAKAIVTYNGKSFDAPLLKTRSILNRIELELDKYEHYDLLHACRRVYSRRIKRCKLTDIEEKILDIKRVDDIPGAEIPEIFFRYLKYKESTMLDKVIEHNLYDILALAQIAALLSKSYKTPCDLEYVEDKYSIARAMYLQGEMELSKELFTELKDKSNDAKSLLADILKRDKQYENAIELYDELAILSKFDTKYEIEIAKIAEHKLKDFELAIKYINSALSKTNNIRLLGMECLVLDEILKRKERVEKKLRRTLNVNIR